MSASQQLSGCQRAFPFRSAQDHANSRLSMHVKGSHMDKYPAKSHAQRVAHRFGRKEGTIILKATSAQLWPNSDMPIPFRQDRYFYYITGCNEPNCYVVYDVGRDHLTLYLPPIDFSRIVWTGRGSTIEEALQKYDIDEAKYIKDYPVDQIIRESRAKAVYCLDSMDASFWDGSLHGLQFDDKDSAHLRYVFDCCRVIKDAHELALLREAADISSEAHKAVLTHLHKLSNEAEVEAEFMRVCIARHAREQAYSPIAGAGSNGSTLHYVRNDADFGDSQTLVLDAGCEWKCYASDITRTLPLNKKRPGYWPSKEAYDIYTLVQSVQDSCIYMMMEPGVNFLWITQMSRRLVTIGLIKLGILKGELEDILKAGSWFAFYPHGLGHQVGLEVHDVWPLPSQDSEITADDARWRELGVLPLPPAFSFPLAFAAGPERCKEEKDAPGMLKPGMVITIEPGVYFNKSLLSAFLKNPDLAKHIDEDVLRRYMPVGGVRIEDDILITKNGYEVLTTAPKGEEMLQLIRNGASKS
ncbi:hypothetical protein BAUCODRAFT_78550 [Baudoinia panamericana UAMH 10762]|uniref:Xaa-Pro aminopeptidase n=1 Tax=Baudoinia panamericana (strain UAMH 10762) TaxID=717646 RepID=M2ML10_BAUPA|nr:uncharacterized protein BAUCODRAFT_78550 [Baudoinia panamericana UAMH 10762]EMC92023.1 hypothetical protein BAUCODRAFT_78550 [Baudoinia panamericana UAMH 10762]